MRFALPLPVLGLALAGCTTMTAPGPLSGQWGGPHAGLVIADDSVYVEFDCAAGSIAGPILLDRAGHFSQTGSYTRGGGPLPIDDSTRAEPARYDGRAGTITMQLSVTLLDQAVTYGPFALTRGADPRVFKCL